MNKTENIAPNWKYVLENIRGTELIAMKKAIDGFYEMYPKNASLEDALEYFGADRFNESIEAKIFVYLTVQAANQIDIV